jgi:aspartate racemase
VNKIGILGGMGPESTVEYYKQIISGYKEKTSDENYPKIFINSINMTEMLSYVAKGDNENLIKLLVNEINKLEKIGADFVAIASNTPHVVIEEIKQKITVPIISIVEETCKYAKNNNHKKVLLTGTLFTMKNNFYKTSFDKYKIECIVPNDDEKTIIQNIIFPDLENGIINEEDKIVFKKICNKIIKDNMIDGIVLGCTELPLMIKKNDFEIKVLDTMEIHIKSTLRSIV